LSFFEDTVQNEAEVRAARGVDLQRFRGDGVGGGVILISTCAVLFAHTLTFSSYPPPFVSGELCRCKNKFVFFSMHKETRPDKTVRPDTHAKEHLSS
jgi:hypothetical protein